MSKLKEIWDKHLKEPATKFLFDALAQVFKKLIAKLTSNLDKVEKTQKVEIVHVPVSDPRKITWVDGVKHFSSRKGAKIEAIIIHHTGKPPGTEDAKLKQTLAWAKHKDSKISYHYVIDRDGEIYQLVKEANKAWHAGVSSLHGKKDVNPFSIGVALVSDGDDDGYTEEQYDSVAWVVKMLKKKYNIKNDWIVGHKTVSPRRKHDPAKFDWEKFFILVNNEIL